MKEIECYKSEIVNLVRMARIYKPMNYDNYRDYFMKIRFMYIVRGWLVVICSLIFLSLLVGLIFCIAGIFEFNMVVKYIFPLILSSLVFGLSFIFLNKLMKKEVYITGLSKLFDLEYYEEIGIEEYNNIKELCELNCEYKKIVNNIFDFRGGSVFLIDYAYINVDELRVVYEEINKLSKFNDEKNNILNKISV